MGCDNPIIQFRQQGSAQFKKIFVVVGQKNGFSSTKDEVF
jgi:hypothetical protein